MPAGKDIRSVNTLIKNSDKSIVKFLDKTGEGADLLSDLFSICNESIIIFDKNGNICDANPAALAFLEYTYSELLELKLADILFEMKGNALQPLSDGLLLKTSNQQRYYLKIKSNLEFPVLIKAEGNFGEGAQFILFDEPASERKGKFDSKDYAEYKLIKNMFEGSSIGVEVFNPQGELILINKACLQLYGAESEEEIKKINLFDFPDIGASIEKALKLASNIQMEITIDYDIIKKEKIFSTSRSGFIDLSVSLTILRHKNKENINGYMLHLQDITRRKRVEKQLLDYNKELVANKSLLEKKAKELARLNEKLEISERKLLNINAKREKFFSLIAHDLKTPFNSLLGFSEYLSNYSDEMSIQELREFSASMHKSTQKVFNLLENLLQWSRFQTGRFVFTPSKWNIFDLIEQVIELYSESSKQKKINIINLVNKKHYVFADSNMINSVLRNLISNAIKFSYPDSSVQINSYERHNSIEISITDNGKGMDREMVKSLFKIDSKISTEGTAKEIGSGLGLILCKEFVKKNKGMIKAESIEGKGSVFTFSLPKEKSKN